MRSEVSMAAKSTDAMDHRGFQKARFSKAEKRAYAKKMHDQELLQEPKDPSKIPEWLNDPSQLPKKPPPRKSP
jgi:hypothetical protein